MYRMDATGILELVSNHNYVKVFSVKKFRTQLTVVEEGYSLQFSFILRTTCASQVFSFKMGYILLNNEYLVEVNHCFSCLTMASGIS